MSERLRLRSVRLDDALWERVSLAAADEGRSASQLVAAAVRRYVEPAERPEETGGAFAPAIAPPVAAVQPWRAPASEVPQALGRPDTCPHPPAARRGGVGVVRHCAACGQVFGLTGLAG